MHYLFTLFLSYILSVNLYIVEIPDCKKAAESVTIDSLNLELVAIQPDDDVQAIVGFLKKNNVQKIQISGFNASLEHSVLTDDYSVYKFDNTTNNVKYGLYIDSLKLKDQSDVPSISDGIKKVELN